MVNKILPLDDYSLANHLKKTLLTRNSIANLKQLL